MNEAVLKVSQINKSYGGRPVLQTINMEVKKGSIYGFIGRNGAGKTTLMRIICGLAAADNGELQLFGKSTELAAARKRIGAIIETPTLYRGLTATDNLEIQRLLLKKVDKDKITEVLKMVDLADVGKKKVKDFSLGMKQRLALAVALLNEPDLLILDEPINGLDPMGIIEIRDLLTKLAKEHGVTILISSHILAELHLLATDYGIIEEGKLVKELTAEQLAEECRQFIQLATTDNAQAYELLQAKQGLKKMELMTDEIIINDETVQTEAIITLLSGAGIGIQKINKVEQDLESYFLSVIGGAKHG